MDKATKILLVLCFVLVAGLGLTSGMLLQMLTEPENGDLTMDRANVTVTETQKQPNPKTAPQGPEWHEVATFTGSSDDYKCFSIQGNKFMVVISGVPMINYDINVLTVDVIKDSRGVATETINWGATEYPRSKTKTMEVSTGPGTYCIRVYTTDLESWQVTIWDYY